MWRVFWLLAYLVLVTWTEGYRRRVANLDGRVGQVRDPG